eukprot:TRINITY_DN4282_c0_g1_i4.p2 TRINITY_DN4282_c0_g1~~TRINITY_DN4282_c0_g1_i4.p2  ORF type:complete len:162 (-),score=15.21 TRINITY_DN4282_c0_g1_i4:119-604(-)
MFEIPAASTRRSAPAKNPRRRALVRLDLGRRSPVRAHLRAFVEVTPDNLDGTSTGQAAIICCKSTDEEFKRDRLHGSAELFHERFGRWGVDRVWRDDIFPCRVYLRHCVLAATALGPAFRDNFLDSSFLGDRTTTLRTWLDMHSDIMHELPPEHLIGRYSG